MRKMAHDRGLSLLELSALAEKDKSIDKELDEWQIHLGKREDNFVIDARLGFYFISQSLKIFLDVDIDEGARRTFEEKRAHERENATLQQTKNNILTRIKSEQQRYRALYGLDYFDPKHYDLVVDTTRITFPEVLKKVLDFVKKKDFK